MFPNLITVTLPLHIHTGHHINTMTIANPNSGLNQLRSLVQLISEGVENIIEQYDRIGQDPPTLDHLGVSYYDKSENYNEQLTDAIKVVEGACAQLSLTVANPSHSISNVSSRLTFTSS